MPTSYCIPSTMQFQAHFCPPMNLDAQFCQQWHTRISNSYVGLGIFCWVFPIDHNGRAVSYQKFIHGSPIAFPLRLKLGVALDFGLVGIGLVDESMPTLGASRESARALLHSSNTHHQQTLQSHLNSSSWRRYCMQPCNVYRKLWQHCPTGPLQKISSATQQDCLSFWQCAGNNRFFPYLLLKSWNRNVSRRINYK